MVRRLVHVEVIDRGSLRALLPTDAAAIVDLIRRTFGYGRRGPNAIGYDRDAVCEGAARGEIGGRVAVTSRGEVTGLVLWNPPTERLTVRELIVARESRRRGFGTRLLAAARQEADRSGATAMVVAVEDDTAARFVERAGLTPFALLPSAECGVPVDGQARPPHRSSTWRYAAALRRSERDVVLPLACVPLARAIYGAIGLARREAPRDDCRVRAQPIAVEVAPEALSGTIRGGDLDGIIEVLERLRDDGLEHIEVRLPLDEMVDDPALARLTERGLGIAGIDPFGSDVDELVLAWSRAKDVVIAPLGSHPVARLLAAQLGASHDRASIEPLRQAGLRAVRQLAAGLAHEINNPLHIILGATFAAKAKLDGDGPPDPKGACARLETVDGEVKRIAALLTCLQRFASRERGRRVPVDGHGVAETATTLLRGLAQLNRVGLDLHCDERLPAIVGDDRDLCEALLQLILNAIEASPTDGHVAVEVRTCGDAVVFAVEDSGLGVAPEAVSRLAEPFFTTKEPGEGPGLGLAIATSIAETHGGEIRLACGSHGGTRVEMVIPRPVARREGEHVRSPGTPTNEVR